jgi:hypothetical protein
VKVGRAGEEVGEEPYGLQRWGGRNPTGEEVRRWGRAR